MSVRLTTTQVKRFGSIPLIASLKRINQTTRKPKVLDKPDNQEYTKRVKFNNTKAQAEWQTLNASLKRFHSTKTS